MNHRFVIVFFFVCFVGGMHQTLRHTPSPNRRRDRGPISGFILHCSNKTKQNQSLFTTWNTPKSHQIGQSVWQMRPRVLPVSCWGPRLQLKCSGLQGKGETSSSTFSASQGRKLFLRSCLQCLRTCHGVSVGHPFFLSLFLSFQVGLGKREGKKELSHLQQHGHVLQGQHLHCTYRQASRTLRVPRPSSVLSVL